uniref:Uncharacterized protein n=1 Tax=mine drainage metagenome TaxID=410659 RepID=E6QFM8_9ZZZZ
MPFRGLCGCFLNIHLSMIQGWICDNMDEILPPYNSPTDGALGYPIDKIDTSFLERPHIM